MITPADSPRGECYPDKCQGSVMAAMLDRVTPVYDLYNEFLGKYNWSPIKKTR